MKKKKFKPPVPGKMVKVGGYDMYIFLEGQGEHTFVFMAGSGTRFPTEDFKPLWSILSKNNKIAVVEKAGYGWSDVTKNPRDISTMLEETREALSMAEVKAPYILVPHSLSGLEAIYWAGKYPSEVKAIIGLDPAIPEYYEQAKLPSVSLVKTIAFLTGHKIFTPNMVDEVRYVKENAMKVKSNEKPLTTPICFFISNGKGVAVKNWEALLVNYLSDFQTHKHITLECGHYVHKYEAVKIASEIKSFVEDVL